VQVAQAGVDQAQAQLDKIKNPTFYDLVAAQEVLKQAQAQLDKLTTPSPAELSAAQQAVVQAQSTLDRLRSPSSAEVQVAQQAVVQAQSTLDKLRVPASGDVQAAQQAVVQAQADLDRLRNTGSFAMQTAMTAVRQAQANLESRRTGPTAQDLAIASAAVEQAQAQVKQAEANLAAAALTAPYSGMIGAITSNLGENVTTATPVFTLVDTRSIRVDVSVDETDVARVQVGQEVDLTFDALRGKHTPGRVEIVSPIANVQQGVVTYQVQIHVDPTQAQGVKPGMTASAGIVTESKQGAILVPNSALKTLGDSPAVDVLDSNGKPTSRQVQTGLSNDQMVEIVSGLSVGDRVVLPRTTLDSSAPPRGLFSGTAATEGGQSGAAGTTGSGPAGLGPQR
jgi:HlyD family secretion protein